MKFIIEVAKICDNSEVLIYFALAIAFVIITNEQSASCLLSKIRFYNCVFIFC